MKWVTLLTLNDISKRPIAQVSEVDIKTITPYLRYRIHLVPNLDIPKYSLGNFKG